MVVEKKKNRIKHPKKSVKGLIQKVSRGKGREEEKVKERGSKEMEIERGCLVTSDLGNHQERACFK